MKNIKIFIIILIMVFISNKSFPKTIKYFKVDTIVKIKGKIINITTDVKEHRNNFIIIELKTKDGEFYKIEVSPRWFFKLDIAEGELIEVKGSLNIIDKKNIIITQSIINRGDIFNFRDKLGFPLWRGGNKIRQSMDFKRKRHQKGKY